MSNKPNAPHQHSKNKGNEDQSQILLSQYIDLLNNTGPNNDLYYGLNSKEASEFFEKHKDDETLKRRMEGAKILKEMFLNGELPPPDELGDI